jgi:hypothetical protein
MSDLLRPQEAVSKLGCTPVTASIPRSGLAAMSGISALDGMLSARVSHDVVPVRTESPVVVECEY